MKVGMTQKGLSQTHGVKVAHLHVTLTPQSQQCTYFKKFFQVTHQIEFRLQNKLQDFKVTMTYQFSDITFMKSNANSFSRTCTQASIENYLFKNIYIYKNIIYILYIIIKGAPQNMIMKEMAQRRDRQKKDSQLIDCVVQGFDHRK